MRLQNTILTARDIIKRANKRMKRISNALGIPKVATYTARHSYATVLKRSVQTSLSSVKI